MDASLSLTRRSAEFSAPLPLVPPRKVKPRTLLIALAILILAVAGFFLIRPS